MNSEFKSFGRENKGLVTCKVYEDGDVVICHGEEGGCVNMADVSVHDPLLDLCAGLDVSGEFDIIDFAQENTHVFA